MSNKYFELVSIDVKPDENGKYNFFKANGDYYYSNWYDPKKNGNEHGGWLMYNNPKSVTHYLRPLLPTASDEKEAEKYAGHNYLKNHFPKAWDGRYKAFLAGILHERASGKGWVNDVQVLIELVERFIPKNLDISDRKQMAMYELYHKLLEIKKLCP